MAEGLILLFCFGKAIGSGLTIGVISSGLTISLIGKNSLGFIFFIGFGFGSGVEITSFILSG